MKKVIAIGLDGLEPTIAESMMAAGDMPDLAKICKLCKLCKQEAKVAFKLLNLDGFLLRDRHSLQERIQVIQVF